MLRLTDHLKGRNETERGRGTRGSGGRRRRSQPKGKVRGRRVLRGRLVAVKEVNQSKRIEGRKTQGQPGRNGGQSERDGRKREKRKS